MKTKLLPILALVLSHAGQSFALSTHIGRDIDFPKDYDPSKAQAIRKVIQHERFQFVDGLVSYWPPEISTRLSFPECWSLNEFFSALRGLRGLVYACISWPG
jgi:hypothetical protein